MHFSVGDLVWASTKNEKDKDKEKESGSGYIKCFIKEITKEGKYIVQREEDEEEVIVQKVFHCSSTTETPDDLTQLSVLNPPSILAAIKSRYLRHSIYTQCGLVLVALNPYTQLPFLYDVDKVNDKDPHVFKVAEDSLRDLMLSRHSQSIIISGESGAGKTSSARFIMQHLTHLLSNQTKQKDDYSLQKALLATNPLLEAFGNARTPRNDNSSRFGKYIKIFVSEHGRVYGGLIETFLLEKSRVMDPSTFHIFEIIHDTSRLDALEAQALTTGISKEEWQDILRRLRGIEALKNLQVEEVNDIVSIDCSLAADFFEFSVEQLQKALLERTIRTKQEVISTPLSKQQVLNNRDALTKNLYTSLFNHLVALLNKKLAASDPLSCTTFVGILDIYGFENFTTNSGSCNGFEQLCINYANEMLQNAFVEHYLRNEQDVYREEGLQWHDITYQDNTACINFIEDRLFPLLEEECRLPKGSDKSFVAKVTQKQANSTEKEEMVIEKGKFGIDETFRIRHFAYDVEYQGEGFLEQNRDTLSTDLAELLSKHSLTHSEQEKRFGAAIYFKNSLKALMETLKSTKCHYIRCIKPNQHAQALKFDPDLVHSQLEACGILATIQLSKAGYPTKWLLPDLIDRFWILGPEPMLSIPTDEYMIGKRYVFMKDGVLGQLEAKRKELFNGYIRCIQSYFHTYALRTEYHNTLHGIEMLQKVFRAKQQISAVRTVASYYSAYSTHSKTKSLLQAICRLQMYTKATLETLKTQKILQNISVAKSKSDSKVSLSSSSSDASIDNLEEVIIEESEIETRPGISEADVLHLLEENRKLKAQIAFMAETTSTLSLLPQEPQACTQYELLALLQQPPGEFDSLFTPARLIFHSSVDDLGVFYSALRQMLPVLQNDGPQFYEYLCFWISNIMELCGYLQEEEIDGLKKRDRLVPTLEVVQDLCVELFKRLQDDFFVVFADSLLHHNSLLSPSSSSSSKRASPNNSFLGYFFTKKHLPQSESVNTLLNSLKGVVESIVRSKMDISLTQPLFSWFLNNIHAHTFNLFMRQAPAFWTVHQALQVQLNLSLLHDFIFSTLVPLFQPTPATTEFTLLKQLIKLILFSSSSNINNTNNKSVKKGMEYGVICPELSRAQVRYALTRVREPAMWVERALEEELVNYGCGDEDILIDLKTPQHFSLKLNLTPKTPPLQSQPFHLNQ